MRLPHTDSAEAIWAFKKGYRFAEQGKPLNEMPVTVRAQPWLRDYFMQGYEQAQAELVPPRGDGLTPRKRAIWLLFAALAGLGTAWLMIRQIQADKRPEATLAAIQPTKNTSAPPPTAQNTAQKAHTSVASAPEPVVEKTAREKVGEPPSPGTSMPELSLQGAVASPATETVKTTGALPPLAATKAQPAENTESAGLLDAEARAKQLAPRKPHTFALPPVVASPIQIRRSVLARSVHKREPASPLSTTIPRSVRQLYFFTEVENDKGHTLHHRWYYGDTLMADIALPIRSERYRTWSSKRLSPAWQGRWRIDVVDENEHVIARKRFIYGQTHENE